MKPRFWLFLVFLCSAVLLQAQSSGNRKEMNGMACYSRCVTQVDNKATCDPQCTDMSGDTVFVDDQGNVMKVANPDMVKGKMGKHMKVMAAPTEEQREREIRIYSLSLQAGG